MKKILKLIERKHVGLVFILLLLSAAAEAGGIALFIPLLKFMSADGFAALTSSTLGLKTIFAIVLVYFLRFCLLILTSLVLSRAIATLRVEVSSRFLKNYLVVKEKEIGDVSLVETYKKTIVEADNFSSLFQAYLYACIETLIILGLLTAIFIYFGSQFLEFLLIFFIQAIIFFGITQNFSKRLGSSRIHFEQLRHQRAYDILTARTEIIKLKKRTVFLNRFNYANTELAKKWAYLTVLNLSPRAFLEFATILSISIYFYVNLGTREITELITFIGSIIIISLRLMPSFNRLIASLQTIKFHKGLLDKLPEKTEFSETEEENKKVLESIEFKNFSTQNSSIVFSDTLKIGKIYGLKGPSGIGKSTLMDSLAGLSSYHSGEITLTFSDKSKKTKNISEYFNYTSQNIGLINDTVINNIKFFTDFNFQNSEFQRFFEDLYSEKLIENNGANISGGERKRIGFLRSLVSQSPVLIYDEVFTGNEPDTIKMMMTHLRGISKTKIIIIVSHDNQVLSLCDYVFDVAT